jgi:signal transduction histidine kinase
MYEAEKLAQRAKDEFLALIAHELRTPVTSLKGYNRLLAKRLDEQEQEGIDIGKTVENLRHYAEVMGAQVDRLQFLIEDLTSISEIETNQLELHKRPTDIAALVRNKVTDLERQIKAARLPRVIHQFEVRSNPNIVTAEVDPGAYERVIQAVLNNAVKFSPKGGLIRVRIQQVLDEVTVTVQDEGVGIKPEDQLKIFERFYKADNSPARANGMGLGLYISQGLMRAMDGHIEVESEEGRGSTFTISLRTHVVKENQPQ